MASAALMFYEFTSMCKLDMSRGTQSSNRARLILLSSIFYIIIPVSMLVELRLASIHNVLFIFAICWATDISCLLFGKLFKGPKLAPRISPGKTWSGAIGGVMGVLALFCANIEQFQAEHKLWLYVLLSCIGQCGDLFESWLKRQCNVKDSGSFMRGHGGILDRADSVIFVTITYYIYNICMH